MRYTFSDFLKRAACLCLLMALTACNSLLPHGKEETISPWKTYQDGQAMFDRIVPYQTTLAELKEMGVDPAVTPNVIVLSHTDMLRRLVATSSLDIKLLDKPVQECVRIESGCYAYQIDHHITDKKRIGNFWLDFFNFRRTTDVKGWRFDAVIVIRDGKVVYKLWTGKPLIHTVDDERSPLGPFQGFGTSAINYR